MAADEPVVATIVDLTHDGIGVAELGGRFGQCQDFLPEVQVDLKLLFKLQTMDERFFLLPRSQVC